MTLFELYYGIARATDSTAERTTVEQVLASKPVHPADTAVMRKAGRLAGELQNDGTPVGDGDVIIAATAAVVDEWRISCEFCSIAGSLIVNFP